ncbi:16S rRNA (cytosine(967)-C(5))-methyltransferase RsmB [bacterium]|nr:16S rRNA (cytosine(967)-C(5))-methyltransferase RsmB [bacterium]
MTARQLAVRALVRQEQNGYSNLVLDAELKKCSPALQPRDAAFAARIFYTTLERQNLLDWMLAQTCSKPLQKLDAPVRAILRAGLAQAVFMAVPLPAAVNESVKLTRVFGKSSASGMVNAVLRRAAALHPDASAWPDLTDRLETFYSMSRPVAELLARQYPADAERMAEACYTRHPTAVRVNLLRTTDEELAGELRADGCTVEPGPWRHCLLVSFPGTPANTGAFREGKFHVQGLASQFAALCVDAGPGMRVLDLCAAPGGKSLTMAQAMGDEGILLSGEAVPARVPLLTAAFARCGIHCARPFQGDAGTFQPELGVFDRVLCDVPCSGLGVMGKKPDIRYKSLEGIENLQKVQQKILQNGARYLAQNGRLVYSTCTVNFFENEEQIRQFLAQNPDFCVVPPQIALPGMRAGEYGTLFLPHETGTDGFFVCVLERCMV